MACLTLPASLPDVQAKYRPLFEQVWAPESLDINWPANTETDLLHPTGLAVRRQRHACSSIAEDRTRSTRLITSGGYSSTHSSNQRRSAHLVEVRCLLKGNYVMTTTRWPVTTCCRGKGTATPHLDGRSNRPDAPAARRDLPQQRRHRYSREHGAAVHLLRFGQSRLPKKCRRGLLL